MDDIAAEMILKNVPGQNIPTQERPRLPFSRQCFVAEPLVLAVPQLA